MAVLPMIEIAKAGWSTSGGEEHEDPLQPSTEQVGMFLHLASMIQFVGGPRLEHAYIYTTNIGVADNIVPSNRTVPAAVVRYASLIVFWAIQPLAL